MLVSCIKMTDGLLLNYLNIFGIHLIFCKKSFHEAGRFDNLKQLHVVIKLMLITIIGKTSKWKLDLVNGNLIAYVIVNSICR